MKSEAILGVNPWRRIRVRAQGKNPTAGTWQIFVNGPLIHGNPVTYHDALELAPGNFLFEANTDPSEPFYFITGYADHNKGFHLVFSFDGNEVGATSTKHTTYDLYDLITEYMTDHPTRKEVRSIRAMRAWFLAHGFRKDRP